MDKSTLEQLLSSYNWWMGASTVAVAIGILGEYVAHFIFEKEARGNRLQIAMSIFFGTFVLGGVVGEYIFGSKLSDVAIRIQRIADAEVAQSNKDAAAARRDAEIARREADSFELDIIAAKKGTAEALDRTAKAEESLDNAQKGAVTANEHAAIAERETAGLKQRFADRNLTDAQIVLIASKLKFFAGQEFDITPYWELKEPMAITNRIFGALNFAGWKYIPPKQSGFLIGGLAGVLVYVHPSASQKTRDSADSLVSALSEQGVASELRLENPANPVENTLHLSVGTKP
jgi:hypothetical protein